MNFLLQLASPRNAYISLTVVDIGYSIINLIFSGSIRILLTLTINPKKSTSFQKNLYFSSIVLKPILLSRSSTSLIYIVYSSRVPLVNIRILSIQAIAITSRISRKASLTTSQYITSILVKPISITRNQYSPKRVLKAIFYSSPGTIRTI